MYSERGDEREEARKREMKEEFAFENVVSY